MTMMRAASYTNTGPADEVLRLGNMPVPEPERGEVLVRIHASGINPSDVKHRAGWNGLSMAHPLVIPHTDGAGVIVETGPEVDPARLGQRVWLWNAQGGYGQAGRAFGTAAEYIAIAAGQAVPLADRLSMAEGACLGVPAMTAWWAVYGNGPVRGQTILVQGAAGAVGHAAVQIALAGGARVIGTIGNPAAAALAKSPGDLRLIDRKLENVAAWVAKLTKGQGVQRIIEVDLAANFATDIRSLAQNGVIASYSCSSNPHPVLPYYQLANLGAGITFVQGYAIPPDRRRAGEQALADLANAGALRIAIGPEFGLNDIAAAHSSVEQGSLGNTVLRVLPAENEENTCCQ
jgi:NADPH:quinone reductase